MSSSKLMKRFAALALLMALPVAAFAQTSRVEGMNVPGDFIKDYTGIYTYTSSITGVGNLVYGELGLASTSPAGPVDRAVGAVLGNLWDGRAGVWGLHLRQFTPALGAGDLTGGTDPNLNSNESFDLMWGKKFGTTSLGLRFNRSYMRFEETLPGVAATTDLKFDSGLGGDPNLRRNVTGFGVGIGFEMNQSTTAEAALQYQNRQFEAKPDAFSGADKNEEDGPSTYLLAGRLMWQWQPNVMVVPVFKYYSFDLSNKLTTGSAVTSFDNSLKGWSAGIAGNWTVGTNDLFVLGANFAQNRGEEQYGVFDLTGVLTPAEITAAGDSLKITESMTPQLFAALETHVNNWLTLRFGARKDAFSSLKIESVSNPFHARVTSSSFSMNLGAGVKIGTLQLDAIVNDTFPHNMPYLISGNPTSPLFTKVTATYPF